MLLEDESMAERPVEHGIFSEHDGDVVPAKSGVDRNAGNHRKQAASLFDRPSLQEQDLDNARLGVRLTSGKVGSMIIVPGGKTDIS
jgi:hypothetical protein